MRPTVRKSRGWWRIYIPGNPWNVAAYGTWERALERANGIARATHTTREESARIKEFAAWR